MPPTHWQLKLLIGSILIAIIVLESSLATHDHASGLEDVSDEDHDPACYPGRNCRPGCYCTGGKKRGYCRPYFPPTNDYLKKYACTGYNYPRGWRKGSKNDTVNSTVIFVMAPHKEALGPVFLNESNFTKHDNYDLPVPFAAEPSKLNASVDERTTTVVDLIRSTTLSGSMVSAYPSRA